VRGTGEVRGEKKTGEKKLGSKTAMLSIVDLWVRAYLVPSLAQTLDDKEKATGVRP